MTQNLCGSMYPTAAISGQYHINCPAVRTLMCQPLTQSYKQTGTMGAGSDPSTHQPHQPTPRDPSVCCVGPVIMGMMMRMIMEMKMRRKTAGDNDNHDGDDDDDDGHENEDGDDDDDDDDGCGDRNEKEKCGRR
ncbi:hypothetical protein PoB_007035000 [Plakobranchus ocellatus]|uniref:Uncharacterized protein n=1 Tax=Plakobranchus ocellatus TaxID=259542 RepID=A0AAV4DIL3_9GAST|nr:hypothetical protein PoB_007035000 [Plakobranchus ocellatus]